MMRASSPKTSSGDIRFLETQKQLGKQGIVILVYSLETNHAITDLHIETRGFIRPFEARRIHGIIAQAARKIYAISIKDIPDIEDRALSQIIQDDLGRVLFTQTQKKPLIVSIFLKK